MTEWLVEFIKGIGLFFLHPLLYVFIFMSLIAGYLRIRRERKDFHVRVYDIFQELRELFTSGVILSITTSIATVVAGMVMPFGSLVLMAVITLILAAVGRFRLLTPSYILGFTFFSIILLSQINSPPTWFAPLLNDIKMTSLPGLSVLVSLLLLIEGILIFSKGHKGTSPKLVKSKRGLKVGAHLSEKLWMVPLFLILPGDAIAVSFEWWPVFVVGDGSYSLILVPFCVGFSQKFKGMLPQLGARFIARKVIGLGTVLIGFSILSIRYPIVAIMSVAFAMVARELINLQFKFFDDSQPFFYAKRAQGLFILSIIPKSPADKMGLKIGEEIMKVNGLVVNNDREFYQSLQKNSAFCKLEVKGLNGEVNFVQGALYEGDHHELGIIFIEEDKKWSHEAV
ncbi:PDZ domain-containing protein [Litchfieldia alkalitelluris]|uniref:PDZ domain-containing protein n=1 Tax=Litchfieldia alkalitelluris TaxID=304268 RepID=UPI001F354A37|nr:PDZ domain-containing protein [Litchfieldia alkalitelluris]